MFLEKPFERFPLDGFKNNQVNKTKQNVDFSQRENLDLLLLPNLIYASHEKAYKP